MFIRIYFLWKNVCSEEIWHQIIESYLIGYSDCGDETAVTYQLYIGWNFYLKKNTVKDPLLEKKILV